MRAVSCARLRLPLPATARSVPEAREAVGEFAAGLGASGSELYAIRLAVSEAVTNAILHAYPDPDESAGFTIDAARRDGILSVTVADSGTGMRSRTDSPGAGLGIGLIAGLTRELTLSEIDGGLRL